MPNNMVASLAKKTGKTVEEVEKIWQDAKNVVEKEYPKVTKESVQYYKLVNAITHKMLTPKRPAQ